MSICIGAGVYYKYTPIANNGLIVSDDEGVRLECISNSSQTTAVGNIIGLNGNILPFETSHDYHIWSIVNAFKRPGVILMHGNITSESDQGIYTCNIPDDNEKLFTFNVGLYPIGFSGKKNVYHNLYHNIMLLSSLSWLCL